MVHVKAFITGQPGCGKTTLIRQLADDLIKLGVPVAGFVTEEMRRGSTRVGFSIEDISSGERKVFASTDLWSPHRFGRYYIHLENFESIALRCFFPDRVLVVDEVGKMEFYSKAFRAILMDYLKRDVTMLASLHRDFVAQFERFGPVYQLSRENFHQVKAELLSLIVDC